MLRALTPTSPHAPLRGRLPLPDPRRWLPYNRSLLQALIFLQTCTFSAFAAPSCGDSASVQTRGQLETGRDGIPPLPPPPARRGDRQLQAGGSEAPGRTVGTHHVPGSERGYARRRCQKHHGHWHSPDRTGDCGGSGQRHSRYCCAALLGVRPASVFVYNLLTQKAKQ